MCGITRLQARDILWLLADLILSSAMSVFCSLHKGSFGGSERCSPDNHTQILRLGRIYTSTNEELFMAILQYQINISSFTCGCWLSGTFNADYSYK